MIFLSRIELGLKLLLGSLVVLLFLTLLGLASMCGISQQAHDLKLDVTAHQSNSMMIGLHGALQLAMNSAAETAEEVNLIAQSMQVRRTTSIAIG